MHNPVDALTGTSRRRQEIPDPLLCDGGLGGINRCRGTMAPPVINRLVNTSEKAEQGDPHPAFNHKNHEIKPHAEAQQRPMRQLYQRSPPAPGG